ncbi:MAG TPA: universal stress protein [Steroidobacter sp.]
MTEIQIRTILAAVADPSSSRQPAIDRAAQLATALQARLILFHAAADPALSGRPFFDSRRLARARGWLLAERMRSLEKRASALRKRGLRVDVTAVWEEPAHEAIIRGVLREQADLVIAGRHEPRGDGQAPFRLTDWELMRLCPRPLIVTTGASGARATGAVIAALDPTHARDKPASLDVSIAGYAAAIADALNVECHAVHCMSRGAYPLGSEAAERRRIDQRMRASMERVLKRADLQMASVRVLHGDVPDALSEFARQLPAQILAMGIISRRWLKRFIVGDTAETVIRRAPCDLLLIKPDNFKLRLGRAHKEPVELPRAVAALKARGRAA